MTTTTEKSVTPTTFEPKSHHPIVESLINTVIKKPLTKEDRNILEAYTKNPEPTPESTDDFPKSFYLKPLLKTGNFLSSFVVNDFGVLLQRLLDNLSEANVINYRVQIIDNFQFHKLFQLVERGKKGSAHYTMQNATA